MAVEAAGGGFNAAVRARYREIQVQED